MKEIKKEFFKEDTLKVAESLLGKILCCDNECARIIEVEAYTNDKASHAHKNTKRSELMRNTHGKVYIYLIYGMYYCLNFTTDTKAGAVLVRALNKKELDGPGKLCRELKINMNDNNTDVGERIKIYTDEYIPKIKRTERIGIKNDTHLKWRFIDLNYKKK
ncbi:MAG: DNA-3-methyladenine glycosylase [Candidatus Woesearchaeota archaeon]